MKVHWLLISVPDEDVGLAFAPFGKVTDVVRERWHAEKVVDKVSTARVVTLKMNARVKMDDLPHQLSIAGEHALVVVQGGLPCAFAAVALAISAVSAAFQGVAFAGVSVMKTASVSARTPA